MNALEISSFIYKTYRTSCSTEKNKKNKNRQTFHEMLRRVNSMTTTTLWITLSERGTYYQSWKSKDWFQIEGIENVEICKKSIIIIKLFGAAIKTKNIPIDPCTIDRSLHFENFVVSNFCGCSTCCSNTSNWLQWHTSSNNFSFRLFIGIIRVNLQNPKTKRWK